MCKKLISLFVLLLASSTLLESCSVKSLFSQQELPGKTATLLPIVTSMASYPTYNNPESLEPRADLIIVGKPQANLEDSSSISVPKSERLKKKLILNESVVVTDTDGSMVDRYTIVSVKILKVIKGKFEEKEIKVLQPAAVMKESGQSPYINMIGGYSSLRKDSKYLLFLRKMDTKTFPNMVGVYGLSSVQGKFNFDNTDNGETKLEAENKQYAGLKAKVREKYGAMVNALP
jgi:hypothetical protein